MKGKTLIDLIKKNKLEDFDIDMVFTDGYSTFPNVRTFEIEELTDIGYSSKRALFGIKEDN